MTKPCCRLRVYNTSDELVYTITTDVLTATSTDVCTTESGSFSFTVPAVKGHDNVYDDIGNNYLVYFDYGYGGSYTHKFSGRITDFTTNVEEGATRTFTGQGLTATLERRFKRNKRWQEVDASDIVGELVTDLSGDSEIGGSSVDVDTTHEVVTVETESYFDVLKKVSDYWYDSDTKVTKDFGIDKDNHLFWIARPLRTDGVATISNLTKYSLKYSILPSKNRVRVYGAASVPFPVDRDSFTESATGWVANRGAVSATSGGIGVKAGTYRIYTAATGYIDIEYELPKRVYLRDINTLSFWYNHNANYPSVILYAPDASNYFYSPLDNTTATWIFFEQSLGEKNEYDANERPNGKWYKYGTPNWWDIQKIGFKNTDSPTTPMEFNLDKLWFYPDRVYADANDSTNETAYRIREIEIYDDKLLLETECLKRANTILYQQKDRVLRLDFTVPGNTNILLGDRVPITLPLDNLTDQDFDFVSVTDTFSKEPLGYFTSVKALDTGDTRRVPSTSPLESIRLTQKNTREVIGQIYNYMIK